MIPGRRTAEGQLVITAGPPLSTDPRMAGFAMKPTGEIYASGGQSAFTPADLFLNGEQGAWYDPSDLSTMFQDNAGTTPVTADGQPVGKILDKSGRGNHAVAPSDAARPLYKTDGTYHWLQFDGVDDSLSTANIDFTAIDKMSTFAGVRKSAATVGLIAETSASFYVSNGTFGLLTGDGGGPNYVMGCRGTNLSYYSAVTYTAPVTNVLTLLNDLAGATLAESVVARVNAIPNTSGGSGGAAGGGSFTAQPLNVGLRAGAPLNGNIYSLIVRGALSTADEITETETWVNGKTGAY